MKAPDKIYIPIYPNYNGDGTHLGDDWFTSFQNSAKDNIAYIRKDALLEWLQLLYEEYSERSKAGEMVHQIAGTYLDVINHINEM